MKARRLPLIEKDQWILDTVRGADVLHVGCTDWPLTADRINSGRLLHYQLCASCKRCVGVDLDGNGIRVLREMMPAHEFHELNAERLSSAPALADTRWDFIVAGDVVEHMDNPGLFFQSARRLLKPEGRLIVTVPSAYSAKRFFWIAFTGVEQVHFDHTAYFSESAFVRIAERNGYSIADILGFQWKNPTWKNRIANTLSLPWLWISGGRCADEIAVVLQPAKPL